MVRVTNQYKEDRIKFDEGKLDPYRFYSIYNDQRMLTAYAFRWEGMAETYSTQRDPSYHGKVQYTITMWFEDNKYHVRMFNHTRHKMVFWMVFKSLIEARRKFIYEVERITG